MSESGIATVVMNCPPANSLTRTLIAGMHECFDHLAGQKEIRALILIGAGKYFVAGGDIKEFLTFTPETACEATEWGQELMNKIERFPVPVIAAINGFALGGGLEMALACDIRIASETAKVGMPECTLGLIPSYGGTTRLPKTVNFGKAKMMIYTGEIMSAEEAKAIGLIQEVTPPEALMERCAKIAGAIAKNAPIAVRQAKAVINRTRESDTAASLENETNAIRVCFRSEDLREGSQAFVEKRTPAYRNR
ncbi:MAG: enoyl-CoA hydratase/isomerase family protein [Clostridiales Family XIII bacterium]|nr:enoyl-CoA hydratase/isomerase family protein [Clostridiales Family XIII bacterium]